MRQIPMLCLLLIGSLFGAEKSPLVLDASNRPSVITATDVIRLPSAGPFYTGIYPTATANRDVTLPDADIIVAGSASAMTSGRVPHVTTGGLLTDSASLTYTGGASHQLDIGDGTLGTTLRVNGAAGQARDMRYLTNGTNRWLFRVSATAESGSDAGSDFQILPRTDAGGAIDIAFQIARQAGGAITMARPTTITGALTVASDTDTTTILGRARISSPTSDNATFAHFDHSATTSVALRQDNVGSTVVNAPTGQTVTLRVNNSIVATSSSTAFTLASGINLAMSGASTLTTGAGAVTLNGDVTVATSRNFTINNAFTFATGIDAWPGAGSDAFGVIARTGGGGGGAPFNQAGSMLYRARLSGDAGRSSHVFYTGASATERLRINELGTVTIGSAALATTATDGFLYIPTCAGTPTGTPTTYTGRAPLVIDSTNNKLYFYSGGAWRDAGP